VNYSDVQKIAWHILTMNHTVHQFFCSPGSRMRSPWCSTTKRIIKNLVTRCYILGLKCTNSILALSLWGSFQCTSGHIAGFKGPTSKGRERKERRLCSSKHSL